MISNTPEVVLTEILVINPNSSDTVTESMDRGLDRARAGVPYALTCASIAEAPRAIESAADIATVVPMIADLVTHRPADAYVIACFSDPGLAEARAVTTKPVVGIAEAAYLEALQIGDRFGVVSILETSIPRHAAHIDRLGLTSRLAGDRSVETGVGGLEGHGAVARIVEVGRRLRDDDGAKVLVLGCAGMGHHREAVEAALRIPVVDPVQAAALQAASIVTLGYRRSAA